MFKLIKVDTFFDDMNRDGCFDTRDMDGVTPNYRIVFASKLPDGWQTVNDCFDSEGTLKEEVEIINTGDDTVIPLKWNEGINADRYITIGNISSIVVDLGDVNITAVACFLVDNASGYVMAYNVQDKGIKFNKDQAIFPLNGMILNIHNGVEQ